MKKNSLMTIDKFASYCETTRDTLLWYDKEGLLKPCARGENGYRYYTTMQFFDFSTITLLKHAGSSLDEIRSIFQDNSYSALRCVFEEKKQVLHEKISKLERSLSLVEAITNDLGMLANTAFEIPELIELDESWLGATRIPENHGWLDELEEDSLREHILSCLHLNGINPYPVGAILSTESLCSGQPEHLFHTYAAGIRHSKASVKMPEGQYVQILHKGDYTKIADTLGIANSFIIETGFEICGLVYEFDVFDGRTIDAVNNSCYRFLIPVKKKNPPTG